MFDGFAEHEVPTGRGRVFARVGGSGPPLLLLHGYPQTHLMWHSAAPLLAGRHTVVVADLPGYGASFRPAPAPDHAPHSKRALARRPGARRWPSSATTASPWRGTTAAGAWPTGWRWTIPTGSTRCRGARRRAHRRGVGARRRRDGARLLALGVPRPARAAARAPDRRRPRRVLRPPRPGARPRRARRAATRRTWWRPTAPCSTTRARCEAICEDYRAGAGGRPRPRRRRPRPAPRRVPAPRPVERARRAAALLRRRPRRLAAVGPPGHRPGARREPLPRRGPARAGRRPAVRLPPAGPSRPPPPSPGRRPT